MRDILATVATIQPLATLGAALVAAAAALVTLIVTGRSARNAEMRVNQREIVQPHLEDLSRVVHECIALSHTIRTVNLGGKPDEAWRAKALKASEELKALRIRLRYVLKGTDEGLRTLSLFPAWIIHVRMRPDDRPERLLKAGGELVSAFEACVLRVSVQGLQPSKRSLRRLRQKAHAVKAVFDEGADAGNFEPADIA